MVAMLVLLTFLAAMISTVLRANVARLRYVRARQHNASALYLAESGVQEAIHSIVSDPERRGASGATSIERVVGEGDYRASWVQPEAGVYDIASVGVARDGAFTSSRISVHVRIHVRPGNGDLPGVVRVLSWRLGAKPAMTPGGKPPS